MNGPANGIIGSDAGYGLDLPETQPDEADISQERAMARFSKTAEFKALKATIEQRITYFKRYMPSSRHDDLAFRDMPNEERGWRALAADVIIEELTNIISAYEMANEVVRDDQKRRKERESAQG